MDIDAEDFLDIVWGEKEGWVDLPAKVGSYWVPFSVHWPADAEVTRRIDSSLRDREDLYYSVAMFSERGRRIEDVMPTHWLWADLDEVQPTSASSLGLLPTIAIESSPGRYQALWRLTEELKPKLLEQLNRGLSYALSADKGGWDLTQVLRLPGTRNYKYPDEPRVKLMWYRSELTYTPAYVWKRVKDAVPTEELHGVVAVTMPRKPISHRAKQLLFTTSENVVEGERSSRLWELECLLAEAGLTSEEIFDLVVNTPWNKWSGVASGRERLRRDISKAVLHVRRKTIAAKPKKAPAKDTDRRRAKHRDVVVHPDRRSDPADASGENRRLPWISYPSFMAMVMEEPKWLIDGIWTAESHGFVSGEPKTSKTTIALAAGLSVASGAPFLGQYAVGTPGPVLMIQEENAPWMMQDRMRKLAAEYGLISRREARVTQSGKGSLGQTAVSLDFPHDVPFRLLNNYGFDLGVEEHREALEAEIDEIRPVLLILDPLYLMFGQADETRSAEIRPFLKWIIQLRYTYKVAVMLVHHMRKQVPNHNVRAGQRILGSTTLHGFSDSAIYNTRLEDPRAGWTRVRMETEFRSMEPQLPIDLAWHFDPPGSLGMQYELASAGVETKIRDLVAASEGISVSDLAEALALDKRTILARVRGGDLGLRVESRNRGRGQSHYVYTAAANGHAEEN